jgi:hypothetical protein
VNSERPHLHERCDLICPDLPKALFVVEERGCGAAR